MTYCYCKNLLVTLCICIKKKHIIRSSDNLFILFRRTLWIEKCFINDKWLYIVDWIKNMIVCSGLLKSYLLNLIDILFSMKLCVSLIKLYVMV